MPHDERPAMLPAGTSGPNRIVFRLGSPVATRTRYRQRGHGQRPPALLPVIGADDVILPTFEETLGSFAMRAQLGDRPARDALFQAYLPKLTRLMGTVRAPYAPGGAEGIWSRDDVAQEGYLVFVELVDMWAGDVPFTAFLLARFPWRLRDAIRRGIGKPPVPPRWSAVVVEDAGVEAMIASPEREDVLARLLEVLPGPLATILVAHVIEGRTQTAIARETGVSRRTVVRQWAEIRRIAVEVLASGGR